MLIGRRLLPYQSNTIKLITTFSLNWHGLVLRDGTETDNRKTRRENARETKCKARKIEGQLHSSPKFFYEGCVVLAVNRALLQGFLPSRVWARECGIRFIFRVLTACSNSLHLSPTSTAPLENFGGRIRVAIIRRSGVGIEGQGAPVSPPTGALQFYSQA
jgi:hypothetical protein